jgi:hypothetical protein
MAKVTIRLHSDQEDFGAPALKSISLIADALEGYCGHILGDPGKMKAYHQQMLLNAAQLLEVIARMPQSNDGLSDD